MINIGDLVRVTAPFNYAFPDVYEVVAIKEDGTCVICDDRDFAPEFLELA